MLLDDGRAGLKDQLQSVEFSPSDLKPRILRQKSNLERLMETRNAIESQLNQQRAPQITPAALWAYINDFHAMMDEGSVAEKRAFIRSFIKQLTVKDNTATLEYTLPMMPSMMSLEDGKEAVLSFEQNGGRLKIRTSDPSLT